MDDHRRFFGYGSLVNAATHDFAGLEPARLSGWRRRWVVTPLRPVSYLSVLPDPGCAIEGAVAEVPGADWTALDLREAAYARVDVSGTVDPAEPGTCVYAVPDEGLLDAPGGILASYLGAVVQGFSRLHGEAAVARFFETTSGWAPLIEDLDAPVYPRAVPLEPHDIELMREGLSAVSASCAEAP